MKFSSSSGRGTRSREGLRYFGSVFNTPGKDGENRISEEKLNKVGRVREALVSWFYKWMGGPKSKSKPGKGNPSKYSLDGDPRSSFGSKRSSMDRSRTSSISKSMSFDVYAHNIPRRPRRSAIDLTAGTRRSGVQAVSSLRSVDNILSSYSFFVTSHRGSHAKIIKARSKDTGERVVLKVYDKDRMAAIFHENITKEIKILTMAKGTEGVVQLLGSFEDTHQAIAVLEECTGGTLISHMVSNGGRLSEKYCIKLVVRPLLTVLAWFHNKGIVVRDLKPEHIVFDGCGRLRIIDLFSAAIVDEDSLISREGFLPYMAPEMVNKPPSTELFDDIVHGGVPESDLPAYSEKVDIWSLGVTVFEALTGRQPFLAETHGEMIQIQQTALEAPGGIRSSLDNIKMKEFMSAGAVDFLNMTLRLEPSSRPSARQLMDHPWVQMTSNSLSYSGAPRSLESIRSSRSEDITYSECF
ncbi:hypothetical protein BSKO_12271 [Bryopsis sp. KO-2023]|nr:hypothetical protein BSKO_12271 [Bryopsis sp. KO-2023]